MRNSNGKSQTKVGLIWVLVIVLGFFLMIFAFGNGVWDGGGNTRGSGVKGDGKCDICGRRTTLYPWGSHEVCSTCWNGINNTDVR